MRQLGTEGLTISVKEVDTIGVEDWEAFSNYVVQTNSPHLLQRRPAVNACIEAVSMNGGELLPGSYSFTKVSLQHRKRN